MSGVYRMTWPVTDPDVSLARLLGQADHDLRGALALEHLRPDGAPEWRLRHQHGALRLVVDLPVAHEASTPEPRPLQPHGTHAAFMRHRTAGDDPCEECVAGERAYQRDRKRRARRDQALSRARGAA